MNRSSSVVTTFRAEATEKLAAIDEAIMSLEGPNDAGSASDFGEVATHIQIAFRHAHGLKGAAGLLGMPMLVNILHGMETVFGKMRDEGLSSNSSIVDMLLQTTETARQLVHDPERVPEEKIAKLEAALQQATLAPMPAPSPPPKPLQTDATSMEGRRVLIVDDSLLSRTIIRDAAAASGWTIVGEAANGQEGLAIFRERPDLVTLDLVMPVLGGLDALAEMKSLDAEATVIIVSAIDQREVFREAFRRGASDFLVKPVDLQRLQAMFHRVEVELSPAG